MHVVAMGPAHPLLTARTKCPPALLESQRSGFSCIFHCRLLNSNPRCLEPKNAQAANLSRMLGASKMVLKPHVSRIISWSICRCALAASSSIWQHWHAGPAHSFSATAKTDIKRKLAPEDDFFPLSGREVIPTPEGDKMIFRC